MILGYIKNYIHMYTKQIDKLVGILIGKDLNLVNLQNINIINTMIGIVIVGIKLMTEKILIIQSTAELENYL
jgi:hypothetical protein